jgi:hypothetical protein
VAPGLAESVLLAALDPMLTALYLNHPIFPGLDHPAQGVALLTALDPMLTALDPTDGMALLDPTDPMPMLTVLDPTDAMPRLMALDPLPMLTALDPMPMLTALDPTDCKAFLTDRDPAEMMAFLNYLNQCLVGAANWSRVAATSSETPESPTWSSLASHLCRDQSCRNQRCGNQRCLSAEERNLNLCPMGCHVLAAASPLAKGESCPSLSTPGSAEERDLDLWSLPTPGSTEADSE